jgi:UDP-N-acetyl-D-mannosaminuronic acid dehydrogenase
MKKISILGLGYIGLPSSAYYSKFDYYVSGFDINEKHIQNLKNSKFFVTEPGLSSLLKKQIKYLYNLCTNSIKKTK